MQKKKILSLAIATATVVTGLVGVTTATNSPEVLDNGDLKVCGTEYISDSNGSGGCITIQGKNVGATTTGAGPSASSDSYGYYFQWGDNNTGYTTSNWNSSNYQPDNAWGGGSDNTGLVYPVETGSERRGPCDEGYHVPSKGEWYALMDMWTDSRVNGSTHFISRFYTDFQIPFAGSRHLNDGSLYDQGDYAYLWSSSPYINYEYARNFSVFEDIGTAGIHLDYRTYGFPVRCFKDSALGSSSSESGPSTAQIILSVEKGILRIGNTDSILNLGEVNVSNSAQELSGSFGANSFWVEDMKGVESGYYTTIQVTDLTGTVAGHTIPASNVSLKTENATPSHISGATVDDSQVVFGEGIKSWHSGSGAVNYFMRENTSTANAGRVGKWGDNLQIKVNIPAHTPYDTYRGTITYTLYDNDN